MEKLHQDILKLLRKSIVDDMDVNNGIIRPLESEFILREEDVLRIRCGRTRQRRAEILLDILPRRGPSAFDIFRQALRHHYEWLSDEMDKLEVSGRAYEDIRYFGTPSLPPMSPLTVIREQKMKQLKTALEELEPDGYIVLHGMKGFGKSCLTASTIKNMKFARNFIFNKIYWIKFGYERPIEEEILIQLNRLYHLVKNLEILPELLKPEPLKDSLIHFLKHHFCRGEHRYALLILDDVCSQKIIDAFDFECKTLVITADVDVLWEKRPIVIEMKDGFTEAETLGLFAKVLNTEINKLPLEAKRIHEECKGMPLLIAMFSAQFEEFKDDMKLRRDRWRYYLNSLRKKDARNKVIRKFFEKQEAIFNMCIEQLPVEMKKRYQELAIFSEDVNIMPQTLEILWEGCPFQVEEMMLDLCHKSLAAKQWNSELRSYIYGVHDLLLCHLRKKLSPIELTEMHKSLVEKYRKYCNGDFSKLPTDNYSYSYIGHHLEQGKLYDEFPNIYFDFNFIQAAIVNSGLSNFLIDLSNYKKYITKNNDPTYEVRLMDLEQFLEEQASIIAEHRRKKCLDIVQIAMNHPYPGYVKDTAVKLAGERMNNLYVSHVKTPGHMSTPLTEELSTDVHTSCFAYDPSLILIGNESGEIFLWDSVYKKLKVFHGHKRNCVIKKIVISTEGDCFLSLSDQGLVKLFKLHDDESSDENRTPLQSPRQKQTFWSGIFASNVPQDDSSAVFSVPGEAILDITFSHDDSYIAGCTNRGTIRVWNRLGTILSDYCHNPQSSYLKNIAFTMKSNLLHIMDETHGVLVSYGRLREEYTYTSQYNPELQKKKVIYFRTVPDHNNSLFIVTEKKAVYIKWFRSSNDLLHSYSKQVRAFLEDDNVKYICAALSCDGQYLVLADSGGFINVWNTDNGFQPIATYKSRVSSLDTYWLKGEGCHIICGSENRTLHKWKLPVEEVDKLIRKPLFDAIVQPLGEEDTIVTETTANTIVAMVSDKVIAESEPVEGKIINLNLSANKKKIIYVTENGTVMLFDIETKKGMPILRFTQAVEFVKLVTIQNKDVVVCRESDENLTVWQSVDVTYLVENAGNVNAIHEISENSVLTVTRNSVITLWNINGITWRRVDIVTIGNINTISTFSCLSSLKNLLAVLNDSNEVVLYKLQEDTEILPVRIRIGEYLRNQFRMQLTCCEISHNEKYLAIGIESGEIAIMNIQLREVVHKLLFHTTAVTQLYWAPSTIDAPVLLSVNADELVWWNIALVISNDKQKKKSRTDINRSISFPSINRIANYQLQMPVSKSADADIISTQPKSEEGTVATSPVKLSSFWKLKQGKDPKQPALLSVVELPSNFLAKVCVSSDFTKFLTVDIYGAVSTFTLFGHK